MFFALLVAVMLGLMVAGCSSPSMPDRERQAVGDGLLQRTSPESVLWNLRMIYGEKDDLVNTIEDAHYWAERYRELFHPDFKFYFLPGDAPPAFSEGWWDIDEEVAAFESLLVAVAMGDVEDIRLAWTVNPAVDDNRVDQYGQPLHPGWRWIHVTSVLLEIMETEEQGWRVSNSCADFYFGEDPADATLWVVTEWWDREPWSSVHPADVAYGMTSTGPTTTWGRLKGLFRYR